MNKLAQEPSHANVSKRELRKIARRLATSDRPELRAVARGLDRIRAGEVYTARHHDSDDYDPWRCARCTADLWLIYVIGVALPDVDAEGVGRALGGLIGLSRDDVGMSLDHARAEGPTPDVQRGWLALTDEQSDTLMSVKAELEPGWSKIFHHWGRTYGPDEPDDHGNWNKWPPNKPEVDTFFREIRQSQTEEKARFLRAYGSSAEPELLAEIRYGSDPRKARTAKRAAIRKGMDLSCLIK